MLKFILSQYYVEIIEYYKHGQSDIGCYKKLQNFMMFPFLIKLLSYDRDWNHTPRQKQAL